MKYLGFLLALLAVAAPGWGQGKLLVWYEDDLQSAPAKVASKMPAAPKVEAMGQYDWLPAKMTRYSDTKAKYTQAIAQTSYDQGRTFQRTITPVPRAKLLVKWQVAGGLEGVHDARNDVYKYLPSPPKVWKGGIPVKNRFGHHQTEEGFKREYPDGSTFMDVLTNTQTGKVFEARKREKINGKWDSQVVFRDENHWPKGYVGLKGMTCATCHNTSDGPGTGGYGVGLVPGGDTIVSDPFPGLEGR